MTIESGWLQEQALRQLEWLPYITETREDILKCLDIKACAREVSNSSEMSIGELNEELQLYTDELANWELTDLTRAQYYTSLSAIMLIALPKYNFDLKENKFIEKLKVVWDAQDIQLKIGNIRTIYGKALPQNFRKVSDFLEIDPEASFLKIFNLKTKEYKKAKKLASAKSELISTLYGEEWLNEYELFIKSYRANIENKTSNSENKASYMGRQQWKFKVQKQSRNPIESDGEMLLQNFPSIYQAMHSQEKTALTALWQRLYSNTKTYAAKNFSPNNASLSIMKKHQEAEHSQFNTFCENCMRELLIEYIQSVENEECEIISTSRYDDTFAWIDLILKTEERDVWIDLIISANSNAIQAKEAKGFMVQPREFNASEKREVDHEIERRVFHISPDIIYPLLKQYLRKLIRQEVTQWFLAEYNEIIAKDQKLWAPLWAQCYNFFK